MRVFIHSARRLRRVALLVLCIGAAVILLCFPQAAATGVKRGLAVCGQLLIPSLFPFLVLTGFLIRSGLVHAVGRHISRVTGRLFGFSGAAGTALLLSFLGGYPTGAAAVSGLYEQGSIDEREARRLLRACVNAGPAFVIGGLGVGMLGSVKAGLLLLFAHITASLLTTLVEREKPQQPSETLVPEAVGVGTAVAQSVHAATTALLAMCGFVLLSSALLSLLDAMGAAGLPQPLWRTLLACVLEVTNGCVEAAKTGIAAPFWLGATLGFGGLSVHGQIAVTTAPHRLIDRGFYRARLLHALMGGCLSAILFRLFPPDDMAVSTLQGTLSAFSQDTHPFAAASALIALMLLCVLFLYTLPGRPRFVRFRDR